MNSVYEERLQNFLRLKWPSNLLTSCASYRFILTNLTLLETYFMSCCSDRNIYSWPLKPVMASSKTTFIDDEPLATRLPKNRKGWCFPTSRGMTFPESRAHSSKHTEPVDNPEITAWALFRFFSFRLRVCPTARLQLYSKHISDKVGCVKPQVLANLPPSVTEVSKNMPVHAGVQSDTWEIRQTPNTALCNASWQVC